MVLERGMGVQGRNISVRMTTPGAKKSFRFLGARQGNQAKERNDAVRPFNLVHPLLAVGIELFVARSGSFDLRQYASGQGYDADRSKRWGNCEVMRQGSEKIVISM